MERSRIEWNEIDGLKDYFIEDMLCDWNESDKKIQEEISNLNKDKRNLVQTGIDNAITIHNIELEKKELVEALEKTNVVLNLGGYAEDVDNMILNNNKLIIKYKS